MNKVKTAFFASVFTTLITASMAANATSVPSTARSDRLQERLSGDNNPQLKITDEIFIRDEQDPAQVEGAENVNLTLNNIQVVGNTVFNNGEIQAIYADRLGKEITLRDVYVIRDQITKLYREEGYVLSRAVLPPQKIANGNVKFSILEGYLKNITVEGDTNADMDIVNAYVAKIKAAAQPLNSADLERYLLLMNDLHGVSANGVLKPSDSGTGAADLAIVLSHDTFGGLVAIDNSGTKFVGEYLLSGQLDINSALGMSEQLSLRTIHNASFDEINFGEVNYRHPIGYEGTVLELTVGQTYTDPGSTLEPLQIEGDTLIGQIELTHPFLRSRRENFTGRVQFTYRDTETDSLGINVFDDSTRVLTLGGTYDKADTWGGVNLLDAAVHHGFDFLDATDQTSTTKSRANGDSEFTKFTAEASRLQHIDGGLYFLFATKGQYSLDALLVGEEFGIGGDYGRGFDFSELTGDHGLAGKAELQYGFDMGSEWIDDMQLYGFYDIGTIWQEAGIVGEDRRQTLASTGVGTRVNFLDGFSGYLQMSQPLVRDVASEGDDDPRLHFGLNYVF